MNKVQNLALGNVHNSKIKYVASHKYIILIVWQRKRMHFLSAEQISSQLLFVWRDTCWFSISGNVYRQRNSKNIICVCILLRLHFYGSFFTAKTPRKVASQSRKLSRKCLQFAVIKALIKSERRITVFGFPNKITLVQFQLSFHKKLKKNGFETNKTTYLHM